MSRLNADLLAWADTKTSRTLSNIDLPVRFLFRHGDPFLGNVEGSPHYGRQWPFSGPEKVLIESPRGGQDAAKSSQDPPRTLLGLPRILPARPQTTQKAFPKHLVQEPFSEKSKISKSSKKVEEKVDKGHSRWSLATVAHKNRKHFHNGRNPEGGGGGRAKRSSIRRKKEEIKEEGRWRR